MTTTNIYGRQIVQALTNKSGGSVAAGDVVIIDTANDTAFTTTTTGRSEVSVGVTQETIANNGTGRVLTAGYAALLNVPASVTRGHYIETHTVAKQATGNSTRRSGSFGQFLTGGTTPTGWLWGQTDQTAAGGSSFNSYSTIITGMSGLVHRWKFEEASGNFADSVGSLTLTASGTLTYSVTGGPISGASGSVTFGASAKGVSATMGSVPVGANARTIVAVFKSTSASKQNLASYGTWSSTRQLFDLFVNDGTANSASVAVWADDLLMGTGDYASARTGAAPRTADSNWHMMAGMYDGTNSYCYLFYDGTHTVRNLAGALNTVDSGTHFQIGPDINNTNGFSGTFDDLAVFTRALAPYELDLLYAAMAGQLP